jgi:hypothetical protein
MKRQSNTLFTYLSNEQVNNLTSIVKETLAKGVSPISSKTFSAADLWNIQRQKKGLLQRRYSL